MDIRGVTMNYRFQWPKTDRTRQCYSACCAVRTVSGGGHGKTSGVLSAAVRGMAKTLRCNLSVTQFCTSIVYPEAS